MKNSKNSHFALISSGILKGKKLKFPNISTTRPTKSIVKSAFFNAMRDEIKNCVLIECFAGSAMIAIESLSNLAICAYAIEKNALAYATALENKNNLGLENLHLINADFFEILPNLLKKLDENAILYIDPPFEIRNGFGEIYEKIFKFLEICELKMIKFIVFEHISSKKMPPNLCEFKLRKTRKFGKTSLSEFSRNLG